MALYNKTTVVILLPQIPWICNASHACTHTHTQTVHVLQMEVGSVCVVCTWDDPMGNLDSTGFWLFLPCNAALRGG